MECSSAAIIFPTTWSGSYMADSSLSGPHFTESGLFKVSSAYKMAMNWPSTSLGVKGFQWKSLWDLAILPWVKNCVWRWCNNAMPTRVELLRSHVIKSSRQSVCPGCNKEQESDLHVLFSCEVARRIWKIVGFDLECAWENVHCCMEVWTAIVAVMESP